MPSRASHISVVVFPSFRRRVTQKRLRCVAAATLAVAAPVLRQAQGERAGVDTGLRRYDGMGAAALRQAQGERLGAVSVVIADDEALLELNARYRGEAAVTDVLSFSPHHAGPYLGDDGEGASDDADGFPDFPAPDGGPEELGEVVISYPQAKRQAREAGRPVALEVETLVAHGVLHLLGYDHAEPDEERAMFALQDAALARAGTERARRD